SWVDRRLSVPWWSEVERNYPGATRRRLEELMDVVRPDSIGKLILLHGPPGTGKTTAVRSLVREWEPWSAAQYISDPERFFGDPGYIAEVLTVPESPRTGPTLRRATETEELWRLIIAEDCDEYLRASARRDAGAALGRLLNLTDGLLGQGMNAVVLLTTNEEVSRLHPALTRPGRCLARVEFVPFDADEARSWLNGKHVEGSHTLAELLELRGDLGRIGGHVEPPALVGQYL
ncbi:MAG: AAA family ATPase, partial [Pseudonocardiaceae bacterium]